MLGSLFITYHFVGVEPSGLWFWRLPSHPSSLSSCSFCICLCLSQKRFSSKNSDLSPKWCLLLLLSLLSIPCLPSSVHSQLKPALALSTSHMLSGVSNNRSVSQNLEIMSHWVNHLLLKNHFSSFLVIRRPLENAAFLHCRISFEDEGYTNLWSHTHQHHSPGWRGTNSLWRSSYTIIKVSCLTCFVFSVASLICVL